MSKLLSSVAAITLVIVAVEVNYTRSRSQRITNLRLDESGFPGTYLIFTKTDEKRCHLVGRRDATMRRYDDEQPGRPWNCDEIGGSAERNGVWLLKSKRLGRGTVFLIPVTEVRDWSYPFLYDFVRRNRKQLDLPEVSWTQLYINRLYRGLYLRVALPFDKRKKDGGSGVLRELLTVQEDALTLVSTRLTATRTLFVNALADGVFPALSPPDPALRWLARRAPGAGTTFLMSNVEPFSLTLLPLPIDLQDLYQRWKGRPPLTFVDSRYEEWVQSARAPLADGESTPFSRDALRKLSTEYARYSERLRTALAAQDAADLSQGRLGGLLAEREAALSGLPITAGQF